ncbi:sulfite exporter TauE/SafE family protein [Noviherbaspirillum aridicola]|uniref:Probable membrane transporter protein n=1 Tax=Noviherbaspirillum aridicola TaxID=2849687 RepID=A0ABQ4Q4Q5_9BURK|nr:sulfite exporter TauE/SafE family protein [Noviherbaspirillum aridicola]GIZ51996.1 permease [Noviherbaspirillum aridicola]
MDSVTLVVIAGAVMAGFVQGLSGFAFGLVAMSVWAWTLDPRLAAAMAVFGALTGQIVAAVMVRRRVEFSLLLPFLAGGLAGIPLGVWLLPAMNVDLFKAVLGTLLVLWCPAMLMADRLPRIVRGGRIGDVVAGMLGGVMGGLGGFSGTLPTLWCTLRGFDKHAQRTVIQNFNLATLSVTMAVYLSTGLVTREMLPMFAIVAPSMLIPSLLGARLYIGISEAAFRKLVLSLLTASGVALLASSLPKLLA